MKRTILIAGIAMLALAACGKKTDTAATGTAAPVNATASASAPAGPADLPTRKAGMWEQKISTSGVNQTIKMCLDGTAEKPGWWSGEQHKSSCEQATITPRLGGGWTFHSVCKGPQGGTVTADGAMTGDMSSHYRMELTSTMTGSSMAEADGVHKMSMEGTWTGPCPAGTKPGDIEMGGMTIHTGEGGATVSGLGGKHSFSSADIAKLREQAKAMEGAQKP